MISQIAMLVDITKCIRCNRCQNACKTINKLPEGIEETLSATAYTAIEKFDNIGVRRLCQHCEHPACASACPVGAITKMPEGPVVYDEHKCMGCRYCMQACPFDVPHFQWNSMNPRIQKCWFCYDYLKAGEQPACVTACPTKVTKLGERDQLIQEAYERIKAQPEKYVNRVFGVEEVGGTSVLYLSAVPFEQIGFKTCLQKEPLPELTWNALSKIPSVVSVGGVLLCGIWWITNRRDEVQRAESPPDSKRSGKD